MHIVPTGAALAAAPVGAPAPTDRLAEVPPRSEIPPTDAQLAKLAYLTRSYERTVLGFDVRLTPFDLPADWIEVTIRYRRGSDLVVGIAPDGSSHS